MPKKKVRKMRAATAQIIGTRDFRDNLADYLKLVYIKNHVLRVGKLNRPEESALLVPAPIMMELLTNVSFHSTVYFDDSTNQYVAAIAELNGDGVGDTKEAAIAMALDNIEDLVADFFQDIEWQLRSPQQRRLLPHYLKLKMAESREQLAELLGLE